MSNEKLIIDFATSQHKPWKVINDGVMGGQSIGHVDLQAQALRFYGLISTANNGGFTSVYSDPIKLSKNIDSVKVTVRGDGNLYQLRIRSKIMARDVVYKVDFLTKLNQTETYQFSFSDFKASFRGEIVEEAPALEARNVIQVGILFAAKQKKVFLLCVDKIEFF